MYRFSSNKSVETRDEILSTSVYAFKKEEGNWYIDLPEYLINGGKKADLEMVEGADELLNLLARGGKKVTLRMEVEPFDNADVLELISLCDSPKGGGYYRLHIYQNRTINKKIWLCDVTLFVFGDMPEKIYIQSISNNA